MFAPRIECHPIDVTAGESLEPCQESPRIEFPEQGLTPEGRRHVQNPDGNEPVPVGREGKMTDRELMHRERHPHAAGLRIAQADGPVVVPGGKGPAVGRQGDAMDPFGLAIREHDEVPSRAC